MGSICNHPFSIGMLCDWDGLTLGGTAAAGIDSGTGGGTAGSYRNLAFSPGMGSRFHSGTYGAAAAMGAVTIVGQCDLVSSGVSEFRIFSCL